MTAGKDWPDEGQVRAWRILQTDFGDGLRLLSAWDAWRSDTDRPLLLHVLSFCPSVSAQDIARAASPWPRLGRLAAELAQQCLGLLPGVHRLSLENGRLLLTLSVARPLESWREADLEMDSLWLEPTAHDEALRTLETLARCCRRGTVLRMPSPSEPVLAALPASGFRRLGPAPQGGLQALFDPPWTLRPRRARLAGWAAAPGRCTVIGAGLAGAACAASLARRGWQVTVLDRQGPAAGASGLPVGLMAPHVSPDDSPLSRLSRAGMRVTLREAALRLDEGRDWAASGVLQRLLEEGGPALPTPWPAEGRYWSQAAQDRPELPAAMRSHSLWHPSGAWIRPARLVEAWLSLPGIHMQAGAEAARLRRSQAGLWQAQDHAGQCLAESELMLVATAHEAPALLKECVPEALALQAIRGQVSWAQQVAGEQIPPWPVNGHGSLIGYPEGSGRAWLLGASFERDDRGCDIRAEAHAANLHRLHALLPDSAASLAARFAAGQVHGWAGVRCAYRDHLPVLGPVRQEDWPGLWVCAALGSRGLSYAALCAELLAAWLHGEPPPLEPRLAKALRADRLRGRS